MEKVRLNEWEPGFCSEVWGLLAQAYEYLDGTSGLEEEEKNCQKDIRRKLFDKNLKIAAAMSPKRSTD